MNFGPRRPATGHWFPSSAIFLVITSAAWQSITITAIALAAESTAHETPGRLILEEQPELFFPRTPRTAEQQDHIEAISLFAAGRMLERQGEYDQALRLYQRSFRLDPTASAVVRTIIALTIRLQHYGEAVRYAMKAAELEDADPVLLRRLGTHLVEQGNWAQAAEFYEKSLRAQDRTKDTPNDLRLWLELGRIYFTLEAYDRAARCFDRVQAALKEPKKYDLSKKLIHGILREPADSYTQFGETYLHCRRFEEAADAFEKAHEINPEQTGLAFNLARIESNNNHPEKALKHLEHFFQERPTRKDAAPYELLAELLNSLGRTKELIPQLQKQRQDHPDHMPLTLFLAERHLAAKQYNKAELLLLAANNKSPSLRGYRRLIEVYRMTDRPVGLLITLGDAISKTGVLETIGDQAGMLADDQQLMQSLIESARRKYKTKPEDLNFGMRLAVALLALEGGRPKVAEEFFNMAMEAKPDQTAELLLSWGIALLLKEQPAEAAAVFQRGINNKVLPDNNPAFYYYLAGALAVDKRTDEALAAARKTVDIRDDSPRFYSRIAWVLYDAQRYDDASEAYRKLIEKFSANRTSTETREILRDARLALSNMAVLRGDLPAAEEWLEQVLDEFPDDVGANNDLGYLWVDQRKNLRRARRMIEYAVQSKPDNAAFRDSLGWVYYQLGQFDKAIEQLEKAIETAGNPPDAVILDHLGDAYWAAGQTKQAYNAWRRALKAFENEEATDKVNFVKDKLEKYRAAQP